MLAAVVLAAGEMIPCERLDFSRYIAALVLLVDLSIQSCINNMHQFPGSIWLKLCITFNTQVEVQPEKRPLFSGFQRL